MNDMSYSSKDRSNSLNLCERQEKQKELQIEPAMPMPAPKIEPSTAKHESNNDIAMYL